MDITAPYLPYNSLREVAKIFLAEHHKDGGMPVPIERIIEFDFDLDIVPIPGLKRQFDVDAYITNDLTEIRVDKDIQERISNRYRFSLAHELSHFLIHKDVFAVLHFRTISEWKTMVRNIPDDQYKWIEFQAYDLAGLILVPQPPLHAMFTDMKNVAAKAGVDITELEIEELKAMLSNMARKFEVSLDVITKRLKKDHLISA